MMESQIKSINVGRHVFSKVSAEDFDWLVALGSWHISSGYAVSSASLRMHRVIFEKILGRPLEKGEIVDHKDRDPLNNSRQNLRLATLAQNNRNRRVSTRNSTGYLGVEKIKTSGLYRVRFLGSSGIRQVVGTYRSALDAAHAYDRAALSDDPDFRSTNYSLGLAPKDDGRTLVNANPRRHSADVRSKAVKMLADGATLHEVSARLSIPKSTLHRWSQKDARQSNRTA
jgi:HNH endonuclease/Homeodomain-like domain